MYRSLTKTKQNNANRQAPIYDKKYKIVILLFSSMISWDGINKLSLKLGNSMHKFAKSPSELLLCFV